MTTFEAEYDFISVGGGIGGLTAALAAHDAGLTSLVLEKSDQIGGVAAYSSGQFWVPANHVARRAGIHDTWESGYAYLAWLADESAEPELLRRFCQTAPVALDFLERNAGVRWRSLELPDNLWPEAPGARDRGRYVEPEPFDGTSLEPSLRSLIRWSPTSWFSNDEMYFQMGGHAHRHRWDWNLAESRREADLRFQGSALASYLARAVSTRGIPTLVDVEVRELIVHNGRVEGVVALIDGRARRIRARRGTLIAVGGYDWNADFVRRFDGRKGVGSRAPKSVTGDHIGLTEPLGAQLGAVRRPVLFGYPENPEPNAGRERGWQPVVARWQPFYAGWPHALIVDRQGHRFMDESNGHSKRFATVLRTNGTEPFDDVWAIFDSQYRESYPIGKTAPGDELPPPFETAETLAQLATKIGVDARTLERTVTRFDDHARGGRDPDFNRGELPWTHTQFGDPLHRPNPNLGPVEKPPFFTVCLTTVGVGITQVGLRTDARARVLGADGPIAGLYAAGNSMSWADLGAEYQSGSANARGMTWGFVAAMDAAGRGIIANGAAA